MKRFVGIVFVAVITFSFSVCSFAGDLKIGYVDTIEVFNEYQRTIDQEEELEGKKEKVHQTLEAQEEKIRGIQRRMEVLREDQRAQESQKLQEELQKYRDLRQKELVDITRKRDDMMREIIEDIDQAIKDYAAKNNYDLIINGNSVLYAPEKNDLTARILDIINKQYRRR